MAVGAGRVLVVLVLAFILIVIRLVQPPRLDEIERLAKDRFVHPVAPRGTRKGYPRLSWRETRRGGFGGPGFVIGEHDLVDDGKMSDSAAVPLVLATHPLADETQESALKLLAVLRFHEPESVTFVRVVPACVYRR